ncbi:restriction endonuclease subunit S [Sphingomonas sp. IW22]|uniref:restriction endonuclease subunit S n=1 Tax=Sphingomonas sp. IW22 TaxID=3242489 RepID=UPI0035200347
MSFPAYSRYQDSGVEWLGEVPSHWQVRRLGGLFTERREKVSDTEFPALSVTKQGIVPQLETAAKTDDNDNRKGVRAGDFVINSRSDRKGSSGLSQLDGSVSLINTVITPDALLDPAFVHFLLRSAPFQEEFYRYGKGIVADLWSTNYSEMKNILLAFPERPEQAVIAAFLDRETAKTDALIEEQRRLIALLKEKRQAVISHAVSKGLNPHAPMKDSGIEWLGEVPAHWEVKRLRFICHIGTGDADTADAVEDGAYPFFVRSPVIERIGDFSHDCEAVLTAGDGAGVGKVYHHFEGKFRAHQRVYIFTQFRGVLGRFFYAYMSEMFAKAVLEGTAKSTVESLRRPMIADFWMTVPPDAEQVEIISHIEAASAKFDALSHEADSAIRLLNERRAALISAAVTGKIDVGGSAKVLPFPIERARARALVGTEIIERSAGQATFGRVKFQKLAFLAEGHVGISELAGSYTRAAAGPLDGALIDDMERGAHSIAGITADQAGGTGTTVSYRLGQQRGAHRQELADWLGPDRAAKLDKLIDDFAGLTTKQAEAVATLYGVWNDLLSEGATPSDDDIITGFLDDWHPEKREKFRAGELAKWLGWMRRHGIVPTGSGPKTTTGRLFV